MYIVFIIFHVIACLVLILVVLLQAGRGGGMSDMLGGGQPQSLFGTQTNQFMTRATEICAVMFIVTSLALGVISTQRGKSLVEKNRLQRAMKATLPTTPGEKAPAASVPPASASAAAPQPGATAMPKGEPVAAAALPATPPAAEKPVKAESSAPEPAKADAH